MIHPFDAQLMQVGDQLGDFPGNLPYQTVRDNGWDPDGFLFKSTYATKALLDGCEQIGYAYAGVWFDVHPDAGFDPVELAKHYSAICSTLGIVAGNLRPVLFDWEKIASLAWQTKFCAEWDFLRYGRPTIYDVEPNQDATQNAYAAMLARNAAAPRTRKVSTQTYFGGMQPLNVKACVNFLTSRGIAIDNVNATVDPRGGAGYLASVGALGATGSIVFDAERTTPA